MGAGGRKISVAFPLFSWTLKAELALLLSV